ncbi:MAG: hypothetical protein ACD_76C00107G0005 [uncultured bacterium]|nr:MAG: hypothetical protein ACD_76C00107G0005 [uncultured bacterium]HBD05555.1 ATP synthase F0 subunit B [Candidatus Uhrbacteria bacterium]
MSTEIETIQKTAQAASEAVEATGGIGSLGINLKIFIAQAINFLIVVLVLWRWVYKPLVAILEKRQAHIEKSLKEAKEIEERLALVEKERSLVVAQARKQSADLLAKAEEQSKEQAQKMALSAKEEVQKILNNAKIALVAEKQAMIHDAKSELAKIAVLAAEKILSENIDKKKNELIAEKAIKDLV